MASGEVAVGGARRVRFLLAAVLMLSGCAAKPPALARVEAADRMAGCERGVTLPGGGGYSASQLEASVLAFARAHLGQVLGTGQCAELANLALTASGARSFYDYSGVTKGDDYVWGLPIDVRDARPGDVLQFKDYAFVARTRTPGGEDADEMDADHHTAIVEENRNGLIAAIDQNDGETPAVRRAIYYAYPGTYPADAGNSVVSVQVTGSLHAYRPQPR